MGQLVVQRNVHSVYLLFEEILLRVNGQKVQKVPFFHLPYCYITRIRDVQQLSDSLGDVQPLKNPHEDSIIEVNLLVSIRTQCEVLSVRHVINENSYVDSARIINVLIDLSRK